MSLRVVSIEQKFEYVALEKHLSQTSSGMMYSQVCFKVSGAGMGLWFWSVTSTTGAIQASGYAESRNIAMQLCRDIVESSKLRMGH